MKKKARSKKPVAARDRVANHRKRLAKEGKKNLQVQIPAATIRKLDRLCKKQDCSRSALLEQLIKDA